jgi:hypothetical protein
MIADRIDIVFSIHPHGDVPPHWIKRAEWHFQKLHLGNLYRGHASVELVQRKSEFRAIYSVDGSFGLKEDLKLEADSRSKPFPNAWRPALYQNHGTFTLTFTGKLGGGTLTHSTTVQLTVK